MKPNRSGTLDTLRGLTLLSMMAYHGCWDLVYLRGLPWSWYHGFWAYVWQQSICCTFILLSGYCWQMGRHPLRRGLMSFGGGLAVSLVTALAMPEDPVRFGVLTFLGTAMLLTVPLRRWLDRVPPRLGLAGAFGLFLLVRNINDGFLGFAGVPILMLPRSWYANLFTAGLGFPGPGFVSSDYFSLLPWLLLFWTGYFLYRLRPAEPLLPGYPPPRLFRHGAAFPAHLSSAPAGALCPAGAAAHIFIRRNFHVPAVDSCHWPGIRQRRAGYCPSSCGAVRPAPVR